MQTFLPYPDYTQSAQALDRKRLGKQRVEAWQILKALTNGGGWANHPATRMWAGHEASLCDYARAMCDEWIARGYKDTMRDRFPTASGPTPVWVGDDAFHMAHRSMLIQKNPEHYRPLFPDTPDDLVYVWPV
jgi:hypothetical protein